MVPRLQGNRFGVTRGPVPKRGAPSTTWLGAGGLGGPTNPGALLPKERGICREPFGAFGAGEKFLRQAPARVLVLTRGSGKGAAHSPGGWPAPGIITGPWFGPRVLGIPDFFHLNLGKEAPQGDFQPLFFAHQKGGAEGRRPRWGAPGGTPRVLKETVGSKRGGAGLIKKRRIKKPPVFLGGPWGDQAYLLKARGGPPFSRVGSFQGTRLFLGGKHFSSAKRAPYIYIHRGAHHTGLFGRPMGLVGGGNPPEGSSFPPEKGLATGGTTGVGSTKGAADTGVKHIKGGVHKRTTGGKNSSKGASGVSF